MKLAFHITVPGDCGASDDEIRTELQRLLESWTLEVIDWTIAGKQKDQMNFEERIMHLRCQSQRHYTDTYAEMDGLTTMWCRWKTNYWLTLTEEDSFHQTRLACHEHVTLKSLCFGTLTSPIDYIVHHCKRGVLHASFFHDIRSLEIRAQGKPPEVYSLKIKYSSVQRLIVYLLKASVLLFLDLRNPPPAYSKGKRVLTFGTVEKEVHGNSNVLMLNIANIELAKQIISRFHFCNNSMPVHYTSMRMADRPHPVLPEFNLSSFDCTYNLHAILTRNFVVLEQIGENWNEFIENMRNLCQEEPAVLAKALETTIDVLERGVICYYPKAIETLYDYYTRKENEALTQDVECTIPHNTRLLRRLVLTPTTMLFYPSELQFNNRILRQFDADYTLRVSFRDDDLKKLNIVAMNSEDSILECAVKIPMKNGIRIGDRHYELLAWSNSQIRDHGVWMYAQDQNGNNAKTIREWMGDFKGQKSVSKYMARLGQCFSQTEEAINVPLDDWHVRTDPDIMGGENPENGKPYCFSDGIGRISKELAEKVCRKLRLKRTPSAFQIRYAGYKGMLVVDPTLQEVDIVFRESMKKFDSTSNNLEIVKLSQAIPVYLNRPMINIMNQLGVKTEVFLDLQEEMLSTITDILVDDEKAAEYLTSKVTLSSLGRFKDMVKSGIGLTGDPFFRGMLLCLRDRAISDIKRKARLAVDPAEGRNMFGTLDETGTLDYGQVFVQYTKDLLGKDSNKETIIHTGRVLVTKNPCTQPGDIRLLEAIDVPALHHIVDCVVFPQKGPRPHPNEMAGSDLDGDEYSVIWKQELFFSHNRDPENFPSPTEEVKPVAEFELQDSINMLSDYIKNDQIGTIGNSHLAISDKFGIDFDVCQEIARKFSMALDYVKTGYLEPLSENERPYKFPDFMERGTERETYCSKRALGDIYRYCKQFEQKTTSLDQEYVKVKMDHDLVYPGWEEFKESAEKTKDKYNSLLQSLLQKYGVQSEVEAISGAFRSLHQRHSQRHDSADVEKLIVRSVEALQNHFAEEFDRQLGITDDADIIDATAFVEKTLRKASSWYVVTYSDKSRFLSFPWVISRHLVRLKLRQSPVQPVAHTSMLKLLDNQLLLVATGLPELDAESYIDELKLGIPSESIKYAYRLILHWANKNRQLSDENEKWILNFLLERIREQLKKAENDCERKNIDNILIKLSLSFLKKAKERSLNLPEDIDWLRQYANDTYQILASTGNPTVFCPVQEPEDSNELVELNPVKILAKIIPGSKNEKIATLETVLKSLAAFKEVMIRPAEKNCLVISAVGPLKSISFLQDYLNMDTETLKMKLEKEIKKLQKCNSTIK